MRPKELHQALLEGREREKTEAFTEQYAARAGIEGTLSQGVRAFGLRQARYIGLAKTHLQHVLSAMALNITRVLVWLSGDRPAQTRSSAFVRLHHVAAQFGFANGILSYSTTRRHLTLPFFFG